MPIALGGNFATRIVHRWSSPHPFFYFFDVIVRALCEA
jgi:hypothetical protein